MTLLKSKKDDLIIIENPESHLHPKGQSSIGKLMSPAAQNGAQLFIESHSDHIINGIRVSVKEGLISTDNISVNYFDRNLKSNIHETEIINIKIDKNGELSKYPEGLLDEWTNLLMRLI